MNEELTAMKLLAVLVALSLLLVKGCDPLDRVVVYNDLGKDVTLQRSGSNLVISCPANMACTWLIKIGDQEMMDYEVSDNTNRRIGSFRFSGADVQKSKVKEVAASVLCLSPTTLRK